MCVHPAYRTYLPELAAALSPVAAQVSGLPGAPVRVVQVPTSYLDPRAAGSITGSPPVLRLPLGDLALPRSGTVGENFTSQLRLLFVHAFVGAGQGAGTPAQQAVEAAVLAGAGVPPSALPEVLTSYLRSEQVSKASLGSVLAVAERFAALPAATRHAWLAAHLPALRSGGLTLAELP